MPFATRKALREAIDNADRAFQRATNDGNLVTVIKEFDSELTKIFRAKKDEALKAEFDAPRFLWECCSAYKLGVKAGNVDDEKWVNKQRKALAVFLKNEKERESGTSAMPRPQPVAGPSKLAAPPIPRATRPTTPTPGASAQAPPILKAKPKATPLSSAPPPPNELTAQQPISAAPSTSTAQPAPSAPLDKPAILNATKTKMVPTKHARPTAARREGVPTDEMSRLTMTETGDQGDVVRVRRPARRLASIEDMEVDEQSRGSKRKRSASRDPEYEGSDDEEDEEEKRSRRRARQQGDEGKKRMPKRAGTFRNPPCARCRRFGWACEDQLKKLAYKSACCACHEAKTACKGGARAGPQGGERAGSQGPTAPGPGPRRRRRQQQARQQRVVESEDSASEKDVVSSKGKARDDDEGELEDRAPAERRRDKARIRELEERLANVERQNKGKGRATREDEDRWLEEELADRLMELEERVANRVGKLEERLANLEREMVKMNSTNVRVATWKMFMGKVDEGLGWIEDKQHELEERVDAMEDEEEEVVGSGQGSTRATSELSTAPPSRSASPTAPTRSPSVSLSGSGSGPTRMDFPSAGVQAEVAAVVANPTSVLGEGTSSLPRVNVIPATPQSSQEKENRHVAPSSPCATTTHATTPAMSPPTAPPGAMAASMSSPRWERILPTPPWRQSTAAAASGPPAPSHSLLAPPTADGGQPKATRRSRSRSPSPGPTRRSPRLQSPIPTMTATPAAPTGEDQRVGTSMDIDK